MNCNLFEKIKFSLLLAAFGCIAGPLTASAEMIFAPSGFENTAGGFQGVSPFRRSGTGGSHNQLVYDGSFFGSPVQINSIAFRQINFAFGTPSITIDNINISLSTTDRSESDTPLSTTFADNIGGDVQTVFSGSLTLTPGPVNPTSSGGNGLRDFDLLVNFDTPFLFDPAQGNLLLDAVIPADTNVMGGVQLDVRNPAGSDGVAGVVNINSAGSTGTADPSAPITQFDFTRVPEPTSMILFGIASLTSIATRRCLI